MEKLPKYDGAPLFCSLDMDIKECPYVMRCKNKADGLLSLNEYDRAIKDGFNLGGRAICSTHNDAVVRKVNK